MFALVALVVVVLMLGYVLAALLVLPGAFAAQWRVLRPRTKLIDESRALPFSCRDVWNLIHPAENAPVISASIARGYRVPGTPEGTGEKQAYEMHDGTTVIAEVVECEPGRRATTVQVSPRPEMDMRQVFDLTPSENDGCILRLSLEISLPRGKHLVHGVEQAARVTHQEMLTRTHAALTAQSWPPPSARQATPH